MKNIIYLITLAIVVVSCNSTNNQAKEQTTNEKGTEVFYINDFMQMATDNIGKEVTIIGTVNHVCTHSGRRCFIIDSTGTKSVRIEAKGEINGFNRELIGMDISVTGIVRERRLTNDYLCEWEISVKEKGNEAEEEGENCAAELQNIQEMRAWMKENNKDYYSIIYLDGTDYEILYSSEI